MTAKHLTRLEILDFIEGADDVNHDAAKTHISKCADCFRTYEELVELSAVLHDQTIWEPIVGGEGSDFANDRQTLLASEDETERDARAADAFFVQIAQEPIERWESIIGMHPHVRTNALVQRLVDAAGLEGKPDHALVLLRVAETVAFTLDDATTKLRLRGHIWRQRSNAFRGLARYEEALDAALVAEQLYAELQQPDTPFQIGQARYAMAVTLFEMTRNEAALREATRARELLDEYGMSAPLANVMMLEALIRAETGDVASARETLRVLLPIAEHLGRPAELGSVRFNLAECNFRLGDLDAAMNDARVAIGTFRALGNIKEETRCEWTIAMIRLARGEREAIDRLHEVATVFRELGMPGEAGFVNLDVAAELLEREEWTEAEILARELVTLFMAAGVTIASVYALDYLRQAVENREATAETVRYVRSYVAADKPTQPFSPPPTAKPN